MFKLFVKGEENNSQELICNLNDFSIFALKSIENIIEENLKIYEKIQYEKFPKINLSKLIVKIYEDIKNSNNPFIEVLTPAYYERLIKKYIDKKTFEYFKKKVFENLFGERKSKEQLFNNNLNKVIIGINNLLEVKCFNNCITNFENEKIGYGIKTNSKDEDIFESEIKNYYCYFTDSIVSAVVISIIVFISNKIAKANKNDEMLTIINNMITEVKDINIVYNKIWELYNVLYKNRFPYIDKKVFFKFFINILKSLNEDKFNEYETNIINNSINNSINNGVKADLEDCMYKLLNYNNYYNREEMKKLLLFKMKKFKYKNDNDFINSFEIISETLDIFEFASNRIRVSKQKEEYLKGNFSNVKEEFLKKHSLEDIKTGNEFENYLVELFKELGYETIHTGKAGDQGCDLTAKKNGILYCIQAKYYSSILDNSSIQEVVSSLKLYNGNYGVVITNSDFSEGAYKLAKYNNVILINGMKLKKIINYLYDGSNTKRDILQEIEYI